MFRIECRARCGRVVRTRRHFADRELPGDRPRREWRLKNATLRRKKCADVRNTRRALAWTRAGEGGPFHQFEFVKAA
jgi:hypothetical protein